MKIYLVVLLSIVQFSSCKNDEDSTIISDELTDSTIVYDFSDRNYIISDNEDSNSPQPLLIVLHGAGSSAVIMEMASKFFEKTDSLGWCVVYPNAHGGLWNIGEECDPAFPNRPNDLHFIKYLIEKISNERNIDQTRIYLTGFSMGGFMSFYLAKNLPNKIAAIAPVAAIMPRYLTEKESTQKPVLLIVGDNDSSVPYAGGGLDRCDGLSAIESIKYWSQQNNCDEAPQIDYLPDNGLDYLRFRIETYSNCAQNNETKLIVAEGGGHRWYDNSEIIYSDIIINFFKDKSL